MIPPGAKQLMPGIYEHGRALHIDMEEFVVDAGGDPTNPEDLAIAEAAIRRVTQAHGIPFNLREK